MSMYYLHMNVKVQVKNPNFSQTEKSVQ